VIVQLGWFMLPLVLLGTVLMLAVACLVNNLQRRWPVYWWTPVALTPGENEVPDIEKAGRSEWVELGEDQIVVSRESIKVPEWLDLKIEERALLESLRSRLAEGREKRERENTCMSDPDNGAIALRVVCKIAIV